MTSFYIDISIKRDIDFPNSVIINKIFKRFHLKLVSIGFGDIGVSFPKENKEKKDIINLGNTIRLHGNKETLHNFLDLGWMNNLDVFCNVSEIKEIPENVSYVSVRRKQIDLNPRRITSRRIRKGRMSSEEALEFEKNYKKEKLDLPFISLESSSNKEHFRIYVDQQASQDFISGRFNSYGLSLDGSTVPYF